MMNWLKSFDWSKVTRAVVHASLMAGSVYIATHPELGPYAPVLQYLGQAIDAPR